MSRMRSPMTSRSNLLRLPMLLGRRPDSAPLRRSRRRAANPILPQSPRLSRGLRRLAAGGSRIRTHGPTLIASGYARSDVGKVHLNVSLSAGFVQLLLLDLPLHGTAGVHGFHGWRLAALFELLGAPPVVFENAPVRHRRFEPVQKLCGRVDGVLAQLRTPARLSFWPVPARSSRAGDRIQSAWCRNRRSRSPAPSRDPLPSHVRSAQ